MIPTAFPPPVPPSALIPQPIGPALASSAKSVAGKIQVIINKTHHPSRKQHQWLSELQVLAQRVAECTAETGREVAAERVQGCMELFERIKRFLEHAARVPTCTGARPLLASRSITLRFEGHKRKSKKTDQQDQKRKAANDQASILATLSRHRAVPTQMQVRSMGEKADEKRDEDLKDAQSLHLKFRVFDPAQALKDIEAEQARLAPVENATVDATDDPTPSSSSPSSVPPSTTLPVSKDALTTSPETSSAERPLTPVKAPLERDFSGLAYTSEFGWRSSLEVEYLQLLAERGLDWFEGRVVEVDLLTVLASMGLKDAFDLAREKVQGAGKADRERERMVKQFRKECVKEGSIGKNVANKWMGEMSECVGDRGKKHEWVDRHTTPLFKADSLVNTRRRPDTVLVNKQLEGCAKLTWSSIFVFAEFTNAKVTLKQRNELHLKNLQAVLNGTTAFNAQSYRHYVLVLSFTKHDLFVFLLDRERVQAATISGWKEGDGFLDSCAVLHVLEHAEPTHLGFPPYLTLDERTNEPSSIDLGLLARLSNHHPSSMKYTSDIIRFPPPPSSKRPSTHSPNDLSRSPSPTSPSPTNPSPTNLSPSDPSPSSPSASSFINSNSLPTIIPLSVVSPTRDSGPFERGTWVGGDGKGLFVKISSPARDRAGHEPTVLTKLHEQVEPSYLGHQIPELVGAFLEDPASTSAWRVDETLAEEYDDIIPRSTEILITRTPTGLKLLSELEPLPLLDAMLGHLEIIQALADAGVSQRDVAPDNARATEDGKATLLDFDHGVLLCRDADDGGDKAVKAGWAGTVATMAPDVLEAMATSPPDFYHRPHYDVISLVILFWYSVSKRVLGDTWASRDLSYRNALLATPTEPTTVEMEQKRKEAVGRKASEATTFEPEKGCSAKTILNMLAWDQGDPILASSARTNLWYSAPNSARAGLLNGMKNEMIKGALRKIMRADPLRRIVNVPTMPEVSEDHPMFEFYQKEQKRLETRFTEEALKAAIDSIRKVLIEARSTYDGKGWDGVALTQGK